MRCVECFIIILLSLLYNKDNRYFLIFLQPINTDESIYGICTVENIMLADCAHRTMQKLAVY